MATLIAPPPGSSESGHPTSYDRLRYLLVYDPDTGLFRWSVHRGLARRDMVAGSPMEGYTLIRIDRRNYLAHRLAWFYVHSRWPTDQLDHINGDRSDNRIANLRECTGAENAQNVTLQTKNQFGLKGVGINRRSGRYTASITFQGKVLRLGSFETPEAAHEAYLARKRELHIFQPVPRADAPSSSSMEASR